MVNNTLVENVERLYYGFPIFGVKGIINLCVVYINSCCSKVHGSLYVSYSIITNRY